MSGKSPLQNLTHGHVIQVTGSSGDPSKNQEPESWKARTWDEAKNVIQAALQMNVIDAVRHPVQTLKTVLTAGALSLMPESAAIRLFGVEGGQLGLKITKGLDWLVSRSPEAIRDFAAEAGYTKEAMLEKLSLSRANISARRASAQKWIRMGDWKFNRGAGGWYKRMMGGLRDDVFTEMEEQFHKQYMDDLYKKGLLSRRMATSSNNPLVSSGNFARNLQNQIQNNSRFATNLQNQIQNNGYRNALPGTRSIGIQTGGQNSVGVGTSDGTGQWTQSSVRPRPTKRLRRRYNVDVGESANRLPTRYLERNGYQDVGESANRLPARYLERNSYQDVGETSNTLPKRYLRRSRVTDIGDDELRAPVRGDESNYNPELEIGPSIYNKDWDYHMGYGDVNRGTSYWTDVSDTHRNRLDRSRNDTFVDVGGRLYRGPDRDYVGASNRYLPRGKRGMSSRTPRRIRKYTSDPSTRYVSWF